MKRLVIVLITLSLIRIEAPAQISPAAPDPSIDSDSNGTRGLDPSDPASAEPLLTFKLPRGTEVGLLIQQDLDSANAKPGEPITFTLDNDLVIHGRLVAPRGTLCAASISKVKGKTRRRSGDLVIGKISMTIGNQKVLLRGGSLRPQSWDDTWAFVVAGVLFPPAGTIGLLELGVASIKELLTGPSTPTSELRITAGQYFESSTLSESRIDYSSLVVAPTASGQSGQN